MFLTVFKFSYVRNYLTVDKMGAVEGHGKREASRLEKEVKGRKAGVGRLFIYLFIIYLFITGVVPLPEICNYLELKESLKKV